MMDWTRLFSEKRQSHFANKRRSPSDVAEHRNEVERDFDRILFSTPVRRLADKTQVFPSESADSVRTRLTHSYEASNIARSIGNLLVRKPQWLADPKAQEVVFPRLPTLLAAAALAHDLGNPPFGHQGESAIQHWFQTHREVFDSNDKKGSTGEPTGENIGSFAGEFEKFDGNPQTLRLVVSLQGLPDQFGLNLTCATVGALLKYTVPATQVPKSNEEKNCANKKVGFFETERETLEKIFGELGIKFGQRHPLAYLVEASDDTAYAVMDVEDAVRKRVVGFHDLIAFMETYDCAVTKDVAAQSKAIYWKQKKAYKFSPDEASDHAVQMLRTIAISKLIPEVAGMFISQLPNLMEGVVVPPLLESDGSQLARALKAFGLEYVYCHPAIREKETHGAHALGRLLDYYWEAISSREEKSRTFFQSYTYEAISENYRKMLDSSRFGSLPKRYRELRLLCDMVVGMTDTYCMSTFDRLTKLRGVRE